MKRIAFLVGCMFCMHCSAQEIDTAGRKVALSGAVNFRDLGGYATKDGKHVKWRKIYRSAALNNLIPADVDSLAARHIMYDLDFRGPYEVTIAPDKIPASTVRISLPAGSEQIGDSNYMKTMLQHAGNDSFLLNFYRDLTPFHDRYKPMFDELLSMNADGALLFHCSAGKDRTGIAAALLLYALGVDEKTIEADYLLTNYYRQNENSKAIAGMKKYGLSDASAQKMMAAKPEYLQATFTSIKKQYGSLDNYLEKEMGLSKKQLKKLQALYLE